MTAFLYSLDGKLHCVDVGNSVIDSGERLRRLASRGCQTIAGAELFLTHNGQLVHDNQNIKLTAGDVYRACVRLPGGKGGFGSMLRALGAQIEKTTNREACRDLSGRRMRDVNDEKKIADWVDKQAEREREAAKKKQEKLEQFRGGQVHKFDDGTYTKQIQGNADRIHNALQQGLKASTASGSGEQKRKAEETEKTGAKKKRLWLGLDDLDSDDDDMETLKSDPHTSATSTGTATSSTSTCTTTKNRDKPCTSTTVKQNQEESNECRATTSEEPSSSTETASHISADDSCKMNPESTERSSADSQKTSGTQEETALDSDTLQETKPVCLADYNSAEELEALGLECLKSELTSRGLKCGGTLQQRAQRLFTTKSIPLDKLDASFFAKPARKK